MAKSKVNAVETDSKYPAKKTPKTKLSFKVDEPVGNVSTDVAAPINETPAKKDIKISKDISDKGIAGKQGIVGEHPTSKDEIFVDGKSIGISGPSGPNDSGIAKATQNAGATISTNKDKTHSPVEESMVSKALDAVADGTKAISALTKTKPVPLKEAVKQPTKPVHDKGAPAKGNTFLHNRKGGPKTSSLEQRPPISDKCPEHLQNLVIIVKHNAEIRRFTALGVLNWLLQKGHIKPGSKFVEFLWDRFIVKTNGIRKEYTYDEPFFLNALVAAFTSFGASAQKTINEFLEIEQSNVTITEESVAEVVELTNK